MSEGRTVLVASGDRLFAAAARRYLEQIGWTVMAIAGDGLRALAAVGRGRPSAILVISQLPRLGPVALARQIRRRVPAAHIVIIGDVQSEDGVVLPVDTRAEMVASALASPGPATTAGPARRPSSVALLRSLTSRERLILKLLAEGVTLREIASQLDVSQHTVRTHMQNMYAKLGAHSRLDVVRFAAEHGLVGGEAEASSREP
jgi:DNA-binding NarL/FixJ family response regulator